MDMRALPGLLAADQLFLCPEAFLGVLMCARTLFQAAGRFLAPLLQAVLRMPVSRVHLKAADLQCFYGITCVLVDMSRILLQTADLFPLFPIAVLRVEMGFPLRERAYQIAGSVKAGCIVDMCNRLRAIAAIRANKGRY